MTDTKQWGAEIAVNGVRPAWLASGVWVNGRIAHRPSDGYEWQVAKARWRDFRKLSAIRLPADHFAYKALAAGFEPWGGGDKAPEDWDGEKVLFRAGSRITGVTADWRHTGSPADIIGYRKRTDAAPDRDPALWDRMVALVRDVAKISVTGELPGGRLNAYGEEARAIVAELAPPVDPDLIEAREIALANSLPGFEGITSWKTRDGAADDKAFMKAILAGIKRGRQLAGEAA